MKKIVLILTTVLLTSLATLADVAINSTNFPDANFRAFLDSEYSNHIITTSQLNSRTEMNVMNKNISDLTGIGYFTQLTYLNCYNNQLPSIDVSSNTRLTYLNVGYNKLTSINVAANTELQELYLQNNLLSSTLGVTNHSKLKTLWVHNNPSLIALNCSNNNLTNLNVSGCTSMTTLECYDNINLSGITGLASCTDLRYLDCEECNILDLSGLSGLADVMEIYCARNQLHSLDLSQMDYLTTLDVSSNPLLTDLNCSSCWLQSLNVTDCTALENLECSYNNRLTTITGLAGCAALKYLDCTGCKITNLNALGGLDNLERIYCGSNQLTSLELSEKYFLRTLDVSGNTRLTYLLCTRSGLESLNVSGCTALEDLRCFYNVLDSITGLADCTALTYLDCENGRICDLSALSGMPNLAEVYCGYNKLDSLDLSQINLETLVVSGNKQLTYLLCSRNRLQSLNVTGCTALEDLRCFYNFQLQSITGLADCAALKYLDCEGCGISDLSALSGLDNLEQIYCGSNHLTSLEVSEKYSLRTLDVSGNTQLTYLLCSRCGVESLNVRGCTALEDLRCFYNMLDSITGLADCTAMTYLDCENGRISDLSAVSGMTNLETLLCAHNRLTTLDVSGKHQLSEFNVISNPLLTTLYCDSCNLTTLNLAGCGALEEVNCNNNHISSLNVTECPKLCILMCNSNELAQLDLGNNPELLVVWCRNNELTELDLSNCPDDFYSLDCSENNLNSLEVGRFTHIFQIYCFDNQISSLDVANHTVLRDLVCYLNQLSGLDVSGCSDLQSLWAQSCQLTSLNVADCPSLSEIAIFYNRLKGLPVGQFVNSLSQRPADKMGSIYAVALDYDNGAEGNHMTSVQVDEAVAKNWEWYAYNPESGSWIEYGGEMVRGDANGDGVSNIVDVTELIDALLGGGGLLPLSCDMNYDGVVTIIDITILIDELLSGNYNMPARPGNRDSISCGDSNLVIDREELKARLNRMR